MLSRNKQRLFLLVAIVLIAVSVSAQSGRRTTTGSTTSAPAPSVSGAKTVEKKPEPTRKVQLLVGINGEQALTTFPHYLYDTVLDDCIRRLGEAEIVFAISGGNKMNRGGAVKDAKQETVRFVVMLDIGSEYADAGQQVKNGRDELYVKYTIFEPETAKVKQSGQTHQHIYQTGRGGVSLPTKNSPVYSEYALKQAAREAADRILTAFDIRVSGDTP